jgi:hypothetical protein
MPRNRRNNKKKKSKRNRNRTAKGGSYRVTLTNRNQMSMPDSIVVDLAWTEINKAYDPGALDPLACLDDEERSELRNVM